MSEVENVIIVGSGPAGYTAALYTARADLNPLTIEGFAWGGLLQQTTDVENYPGFPDGVMGPEMMQKFREQAVRFGGEDRFISDEAARGGMASDGGRHGGWGGDLFIALGHRPTPQPREGHVDKAKNGYVLTQGKSTRTNLPGVFASGDVVDHVYRQAVTAAGSGCQAALDAEWYLRDRPLSPEDHWYAKDAYPRTAAKQG